MNTSLKQIGAALVAIIAIAGFAVLYWYEIVHVWTWAAGKGEFAATTTEQMIYVATILAGLVGGVTAMIFNEKLPDDPNTPPANPANPATPSATGAQPTMTAIVNSLIPSDNTILSLASVFCVLVYFITGIAAIVTWVYWSSREDDLIKNLALISIGLFVAIAKSFFRVQ